MGGDLMRLPNHWDAGEKCDWNDMLMAERDLADASLKGAS